MNLSWNEIEERASQFAAKWQGEVYEKGESQSFWSDFLNVFGIDRRRHGAFFEYAIKKSGGSQGFIDLFWPGKLLAEQKSGGKDLAAAKLQANDYLANMPDYDLPIGIIVSDFKSFHFTHTTTNQTTEFELTDFPKQVKLFGFLLGLESKKLAEEDPVNRKAAEAMAELHNQLQADNYIGHDLELLLVRLVFCFFADDSGIFERSSFNDYVVNRTNPDGSDLGSRLIQLFEILNTPEQNRQQSLDQDLAAFPYVNGGLFQESLRTPSFTSAMRKQILAAMSLDWSQVSPAIFGSMFQGVMDEKQRRNLGAHYTSEANILKVIKPLFLDDLYAEFAAIKRSKKKLEEFHNKLASLTFLDPACGSGNFLVITYRELRRLEHKVIQALQGQHRTQGMFDIGEQGIVKTNVDQMYGIEVEEFPSLIAQTALWLTDHQMNREFSQESGTAFKRLPLTTSAHIHHANALTTDWAEVINPQNLNYILGNPPFLGQAMQSTTQKKEVAEVLSGIKLTGVLDFVSAWYGKAEEMMTQNPNIQTALVSTNSITQGEQVGILWKYLLEKGISISFAHRTFRWTNDAKGVAAVHCVIIGFNKTSTKEKRLFEYTDVKGEPIESLVANISPYLVDAPSVVVESRSKPLANVPLLKRGNSPYDGGHYLFTESQYKDFLLKEPGSKKYFRKFLGAREYLNGENKYCLWLLGANPADIKQLPLVMETINKVRQYRQNAPGQETKQHADTPTQFRDKNEPDHFVVVPRVSSENRMYIPMGFFDASYIPGDTIMFLPEADLFHFGILTSQMHMAWVRSVCGRLKSDYRYSKDIVYNNFIWPGNASDQQKREIEQLAQAVLDARAKYPTSTLADLYDPLTMPPDLLKAHKTLDKAVDKLYRNQSFTDDAERVAFLFNKYEEEL